MPSRTAQTEMSVLLDVLNVAKEKRYMVLDPVVSQAQTPETHEPKHAVTMLGKKRVGLV